MKKENTIMKKVLAMLMAALMVAAMFTGCGSKKAAESSDAIKIGMCGPLTGGAAVYGTAVQAGMEIAVEEVNAKGGLQFELKCQDDEHDTEKAANAYNALKGKGMQIMAGPVTTAPCNVVAAECANDKIFMLTPSGSGASIIEYGDNIFQICFTDPNQGVASADYMATHDLGSTIGVIYDSSDVYSSGIYEKFAAEAQVKGLNIACVEAFTADNKSDLTTQVTKCKDAGCDLVFLPFYATEAAQVLTYANTIGYAPTFFGVDGMDGILTAENFDASLAEGVYLLTPFSADSEDEMTQNFVAEYQDRFGEIPNQFGADAYDAIYTLYQAIQAAGATADMSNEEICDALIEVMPTLAVTGLTSAGSEMTWDENGAVSKDPTAVIIENGTYVTP